MSADLEAAGALVSAGLAAAEIDSARGPAGTTGRAHGPCRNCGATLGGAYCQACGQSAHAHRSLVHLAEEVLHGVLHFDTKAWRTLPLLVLHPGVLTRRYIEGQRTRYVSPLALFLFTVFLMFFVASLGSRHADPADKSADARLEVDKDLADARAEERRAVKALADARARNDDVAEAEQALVEARRDVAVTAGVRAAVSALAGASTAPGGSASAAASVVAATGHGGVVILDGIPDIDTGIARIDAALKRAKSNPELALYKLKSTAYKFSFMLVPISLPFVWLLFAFRRDIAMYDHAVFVLYSLSFMSLLFVVAVGIGAVPGAGKLAALTLLVPPVHMARQLHEAYRLAGWATLWRAAVLVVVAAVVLALFALLVVTVTMT